MAHKLPVSASASDKLLLDNTMPVYRDVCNYVSDYVFRLHDLKPFSLNEVMYSDLREKGIVNYPMMN